MDNILDYQIREVERVMIDLQLDFSLSLSLSLSRSLSRFPFLQSNATRVEKLKIEIRAPKLVSKIISIVTEKKVDDASFVKDSFDKILSHFPRQ